MVSAEVKDFQRRVKEFKLAQAEQRIRTREKTKEKRVLKIARKAISIQRASQDRSLKRFRKHLKGTFGGGIDVSSLIPTQQLTPRVRRVATDIISRFKQQHAGKKSLLDFPNSLIGQQPLHSISELEDFKRRQEHKRKKQLREEQARGHDVFFS